MVQSRALHPRAGVHDQSASTPVRAANSVRRTITLDTYRFDGPAGPATLIATGRDLLTPATGAAVVADRARVEISMEPLNGVIRSVGGASGLDVRTFVGASPSAGFRRVLQKAVAPSDRGTLLYRMLDDLPGAVLVSSMPLVTAGVYPLKPQQLLVLTDVCRGWADGGSQHADIARDLIPTPTGPVPSDLSVADDPLAWHDPDVAAPDFTRRSRRFDVSADGTVLTVDAHYRDVIVTADGPGEVIHEYSLSARAERASMELTGIQVKAHALPWTECNDIPASAQQLVGARLGELETPVRTRLAGTAGCTHLNDMFRGLDAVPSLAAVLTQEIA